MGGKKRKHGALQIIIGLLLCVFLATGVLFLNGNMEESRDEKQSMFIQEVESELGIDIPNGEVYLDFSFDYPKHDDSRKLNDISVSLPENEAEAFRKTVSDDPKWIDSKEVLQLSSVWNRTIGAEYVAEEADYVMVYNITDGTYNTLPESDGSYTMLNLIYYADGNSIRLIKYVIDYSCKP